jgi:uncharacterized damage-inducible protein DinB
MDLLDRLLKHDSWTTGQLLTLCLRLNDAQLDRQFDIGHRSLRATLDHIIRNMEVWSAMMAGQQVERIAADRSPAGMLKRLDVAANRLARVARDVANRGAWNETWIDTLDEPPRAKSFGSGIAHLLTHSMHHRAQVLYLLRLSSVPNLPEGDVFSWEASDRRVR